MNVYNYLELNFIAEHNLNLYGEILNDLKTLPYFVNDNFATTNGFYSQPFKPEMICEYFEGWEQDYDYSKGFADKTNFIIYFTQLEMSIIKRKQGIQVKFYIPETLNDFIRDCQRAGIELTWKVKV